MRNPTSGNQLPNVTALWLNAAQGLAANTPYAPAAIVCNGARVGNHVLVSANGPLPATAGGADPNVTAFVSSADHITFKVSNNNANALVALGAGADVTFSFIAVPVTP